MPIELVTLADKNPGKILSAFVRAGPMIYSADVKRTKADKSGQKIIIHKRRFYQGLKFRGQKRTRIF